MKRKISKNYIGAAATVTVSSGMPAKLVIEELTPCTDVFFHFPNTHSALKWSIVYHSLSKMN
jgi:hypothetical protein